MSEQDEPKPRDTSAEKEPAADARLQNVCKTESKTAGRLRMRVHQEARTPEQMALIKENLESHPDIDSVEVNQRTGSVVIKHGQKHDGHKLFWEALDEIDLVGEAALDIPDEKDGEEPTQKLEQQLADLAYSIDKSLYKVTGENLHLGLLIPAGIAGIGVAQIAVFGIGLELLPGPVLLWIAYDIYRRIGKEPPFVNRDGELAIEDDADEKAIDAEAEVVTA